jgi:curved DNA-binding protein CbpA
MTDTDAYDILGLKPGADRDAIIQAHRRLMQKAHPDRGGSDWLAAKINAARSHLLEE